MKSKDCFFWNVYFFHSLFFGSGQDAGVWVYGWVMLMIDVHVRYYCWGDCSKAKM